MSGARSAEIDAYLAALRPEFRDALENLRGMIASAAPDATETISYAVPAFKYRGRSLVAFGAATNHCSFFVQSPAVLDAHRDEVQGFDTSKGTIRFTPDKPLPKALVMRLVEARIAETNATERSKSR